MVPEERSITPARDEKLQPAQLKSQDKPSDPRDQHRFELDGKEETLFLRPAHPT